LNALGTNSGVGDHHHHRDEGEREHEHVAITMVIPLGVTDGSLRGLPPAL
jgi:hypothetical protein